MNKKQQYYKLRKSKINIMIQIKYYSDVKTILKGFVLLNIEVFHLSPRTLISLFNFFA